MTILQTDNKLYEPINKYGCYFMSLLAIVCKEYDMEYTAKDIREIYNRLLGVGAMDIDCYVMAPDAVLKYATRHITAQITDSIVQVGIKDNAGERFWGWVKGKIIDYTIAKFSTVLGNNHFILLNNEGGVEYDPNPNCKVDTQLALIYYRKFRG